MLANNISVQPEGKCDVSPITIPFLWRILKWTAFPMLPLRALH